MRHDGINQELLSRYAPRPGRKPLLPALGDRQQLALLCRVLSREGYNDHIAGHITLRLDDGSYLANPWELTWSELTASDILRLDAQGQVIEGDWNITPAIRLHMDVHEKRHDVRVVIHNHPEWSSVWSATGKVPPVYDQTSALVDTDPVVYDEYRGTVEQREAHLRAITLEWRCRLAWRVQALGGGTPLSDAVIQATGARTDLNGFPFLWEAMCREEIRRDPRVLD